MDLITEQLIEETYMFCYKRLNNPTDAEDLAQDILFEAVKALRSGRNIHSFNSYFRKLAHNRYAALINRRNKLPTTISLETFDVIGQFDSDTMLDDLISDETAREIHFAISRLSRLHREVLVEYYLKGNKIETIAQNLNVPVGTIKRRLFDAKRCKCLKRKTQVLKNNLYILKICFNECPWHLTYFAVMNLISEIVMFLEWVFGIKYVLESAEFGYPLSRPVTFLCIMLGVHTVNALLGGFCWHNIWQKAQPRMQKAIKSILYEKARTLDLECYDDPEYYDRYVLTINEANNMINRATQLLQRVVMSVTNIVLYGGFYLYEDSTSVLFVIGSFALTYVFSILLNKVNFSRRMECNPVERRREYIHRVHYLADYAKELRLNPEYTEVLNECFTKANEELEKINRSYAKKKFGLAFLKSYISNEFIIQVLFLIYLVYRAAVMKAISYSDIVVLFNSAQRLKKSLKTIAELFTYAQETSLYVDKMNEFLDYTPVISDGDKQINGEEHKITLDNVGFSYNKKQVLNGIDIEINPNDKIAIVGYNGAGKTTLVKLLMRLYDTTSGTISLDGNNIFEYRLDEYRKLFGTAFQDFKIFACTLRENVTLSGLECKDTEVFDALNKAGMTKKLSALKDGLDTLLTTEFSSDGVNLSGGEAQKTAIARALYRKSPIIILDEPSAALDPISEYEFNNSIMNECGNKTIIFISHRLSATRNADKIIMLENGRIIEFGTHSQLLEQNGKYAEMWRVQAGQYI